MHLTQCPIPRFPTGAESDGGIRQAGGIQDFAIALMQPNCSHGQWTATVAKQVWREEF